MTRRTHSATTDAWHPRPLMSLAMRIVIYGIPLLAGLGISSSLGQLLPSTWNTWLVLALRAVAAVAASMVVASATTRLLPLALLLKMTMIFPDVAPSRLAVARRTTSVKELTRRLEHGEPSEREAATTMLALVAALDRHDRKTRGHSERVRLFCDLLGDELGLDQPARGRLRWAALVHDVGKLHVSQRVLTKPSSLTDSEWTLIKAHPDAGARLAQPLATWLGPWFAGIAEHHEHFDGTGYPRGLAGENISLAGRAIAVVDAFETMTAARAYKSPMSTWSARSELARCSGTHFDPVVVRAFLRIALPRVLRVVGPLAFLINAPLLKIVGQAPVRAIDAAALGTSNALSAAGVTAVAVAVTAAPVGAVEQPASHPTVAAVQHAALRPGGAQGYPAPVPDRGPGATGTSSPAPKPARTSRPTAKPRNTAGGGAGRKSRPTSAPGPHPDPPAPEPRARAGTRGEDPSKDRARSTNQAAEPQVTPGPPAPDAPSPAVLAPSASVTLPPVLAFPAVPAAPTTAPVPGPVGTVVATVLGQLTGDGGGVDVVDGGAGNLRGDH